MYIQGYDEDGIVYSKFDDETLTNDLYGVNLKTGENLLIAKGENDSNKELLGYADGKAYYCISKENPFVLKTNTVYQFQFDSGESRMLYQKESIPGATDVQPGTQSFQLVDGKIYVVMPNGMELRWMKVDPDASAVIFQDQNLVVGEKKLFKYGTVVTDSYILNCPFCGIPLEKYYGEEFQLDARYSAYADDINKKLSNELHDLVQRNLEEFDQLGSTDEECGDHQENPHRNRDQRQEPQRLFAHKQDRRQADQRQAQLRQQELHAVAEVAGIHAERFPEGCGNLHPAPPDFSV